MAESESRFPPSTRPDRSHSILAGIVLELTVLAVVAVACQDHEAGRVPPPSGSPSRREAPTIVFLGTSLTAGLGLDPYQAYPAIIQRRLDAEGLEARVINAGVSGETSAGALRRLDWLLQQATAVLVVETGANDGLRAQDPDATRANLQAIIERARRATPPPKLLVLGMEAPPNFGAEYARRFRAIYRDVARDKNVPLVPFVLAGVAGDPLLNQPDGIHPTAAGQEIIAATVWKALRPLL